MIASQTSGENFLSACTGLSFLFFLHLSPLLRLESGSDVRKTRFFSPFLFFLNAFEKAVVLLLSDESLALIAANEIKT